MDTIEDDFTRCLFEGDESKLKLKYSEVEYMH